MRSPSVVPQGAQSPRVRHAPAVRANAWEDVADVARAYGLVLDEWQEGVLEAAMGERSDGKWATPRVGISVPRQNGKGPHSLDTKVLTTDGWSTFAEIEAGQRVYDHVGMPVEVVATSPVYPAEGDHYRVTFTDGASHVVAAEHLWHVRHKDWGAFRDVPTSEIAENFGGVRPDNGRMEFNYRVRCDAVPETPDADLPIDPYLLGVWLGDGTSGKAEVACGREDVAWVRQRIEGTPGVRSVSTYRADSNGTHYLRVTLEAKVRDGFESRCKRLGLWRNKHIPEVYLTASPRQRLALLQGLMDTDGNVARAGTSRVEFSSSYPELAAGVHRLIRSLGVRVAPKVGPSTLNGERKRDRTRFVFSPQFCPFQMPRKAGRWAPSAGDRHSTMSIVAVERVAPVETRCITIADPRGVYLVGELFTPTHNSIIEARELAGLLVFGEQSIVHSAHQQATARVGFERIKAYFDNYDDLRRKVKSITSALSREAIELKTGQMLRFPARTKATIRGFSIDCLILDEAQIFSDLALQAVQPTMAARPNPQMWLLGTPPTLADDGAVFTRCRDDGLMGKDRRLCWCEWSCEPGVDLDDREAWAASNPALGIRIGYEAIADERAAMSDEGFARERLGMWSTASVASVIAPQAWRDVTDEGSVAVDSIALAVDVSPDRERASVALAGRRRDDLWHVELVDQRDGVGWVVEAVGDLVAANPTKIRTLVVEGTSPAGALVDDLRRQGVRATVARGQDVTAACGRFFDGVAEQWVRHIGQEQVTVALSMARKRTQPDGAWVWSRKSSGGDITPLTALTLALWGAQRKASRSWSNDNSTGGWVM